MNNLKLLKELKAAEIERQIEDVRLFVRLPTKVKYICYG